MTVFTLRRRYFAHATFGELLDEKGQTICVTVECPWRNNQPNQSCIPEGTYQLLLHDSATKGQCLAIEGGKLGVTLNGPSLRTACLIHVANKASELAGCIAPGTEFGALSNEWAVLNSRVALKDLLNRVGHNTAILHIVRD